MYYVEKITALEDHVKEHPKDYQAVIALMIARSDQYEYERKQKMIERKKNVAKYRRMLNEREPE